MNNRTVFGFQKKRSVCAHVHVCLCRKRETSLINTLNKEILMCLKYKKGLQLHMLPQTEPKVLTSSHQ